MKGSKTRTSLISAARFFLLLIILIPAAYRFEDRCAVAGIPGADDKPGVIYCWLSGGKIHAAGLRGVSVLPIGGNVLQMQYRSNEVYYVREGVSAENEMMWIAGYCNPEGGTPLETAAGMVKAGASISRLMGEAGTLFMLAGDKGHSECGGTLYEIKLDGSGILMRERVADFTLCRGRPVCIERKEDGAHLAAGGRELSLGIAGDLRFAENIGGRILFISNGSESEIIDIASMRSIGLYSREVRYEQPGEFNLVIELADSAAFSENDTHVFYKVFLDGSEAGRTDTGPAGSIRTCRLKTAPDAEHIIKLERWELDRRREKYERANNIRQPVNVKVYASPHLVIRISGRFDGTAYIFQSSPVVEK